VHARITWGRVKPGHWDQYEEIYRHGLLAAQTPEGLRGRVLIRDVDDPDSGGTISLWDTDEDLRAYEEGDVRAEILALMREHFGGTFHAHRCEVRHLGLLD
jgi:heme-degrading monooxygenase HmoA